MFVFSALAEKFIRAFQFPLTVPYTYLPYQPYSTLSTIIRQTQPATRN